MNLKTLPFQSKTLDRAKDSDKYKLYRSALEWDLVEPIVIEDREDMRSESKWRDRVEPYRHQVTNLITFCRRLPVTLLADDVGLGKTISAGLVMSELIARGRIAKILVVCPKILREQWKEELDIKFGIPSAIVTGRDLIIAEPPEEIGAVITTYNTARLYLEKVKSGAFDMLILDEAHKLRNLYGVDQTPQVALRFHKALSDRLFKYVLMLTATPIQNRLWDLYSLVDLLTVARGHENPFGNPGIFARKFIADSRTTARQLKPEMRDEFRSIVYGYMSRIRRDDAKLHFPERKVQLHKVEPTQKELALFKALAEPIQKLNFLAQIVILQALVSSPEALTKLLDGMAAKGTAPKSLAKDIKELAQKVQLTTKLQGLNALIKNLKEQQPDTWRVVVFTRWRETQITIENFLEKQKISCGLINGDSNTRNQEVIARFKKDIPDVNVIISTEAGSEGVNLQAANVLVNYDLPWNPMIVEQRIGRIQRLASNFANVSIFNIVLKDTFEEYIVGRLMEKLQLASHAIGDIEALLEASGIDEGEENGSSGFEERIRQLVVASLAGKDVEQATRKAEKSITDAKTELVREEKNINSLLGGMGNASQYGPRCPKLPQIERLMDSRSFVLAALEELGAKLKKESDNLYLIEFDGKKHLIRFDNNVLSQKGESVLYAPGTAAFERLVSRLTSKGLHLVFDNDEKISLQTEELTQKWVEDFGASLKTINIQDVSRCFSGKALIRVRATVAHDSYERLVEVECDPKEHFSFLSKTGIEPIGNQIENPTTIGALSKKLAEKATQDPNILDFCRFYTERREQEIASAGSDTRKRKKLEDEFTPRIELSLVGLEGGVYRDVKVRVSYEFDSGDQYTSSLVLTPSSKKVESPEMGKCMKTGKLVPKDCLEKCAITKQSVLRHLLTQSEISERLAYPEHTLICAYSRKRILADEAEKSSVTGDMVAKKFLKTSSLSGKRAEEKYFGVCHFTKSEVLETELATSQVSGKKYRVDEQLKSVVSGTIGHKQEFVFSVISNTPLLETEGLRSSRGNFCSPLEARSCSWSGRKSHPEDLKECDLTGVSIYTEYLSTQAPFRFELLYNFLNGTRKKSDKTDLWPAINDYASMSLGGGRCNVDSAELSPDGKNLAVVLEVKTWMGLRTRHVGLIYSHPDHATIGRVVIGKRGEKGWVPQL